MNNRHMVDTAVAWCLLMFASGILLHHVVILSIRSYAIYIGRLARVMEVLASTKGPLPAIREAYLGRWNDDPDISDGTLDLLLNQLMAYGDICAAGEEAHTESGAGVTYWEITRQGWRTLQTCRRKGIGGLKKPI